MDGVKKGGWLKRHMRLTLILLYVVAVLVPGAVLSGLALRALDREEAYVEKSLKVALLAEVSHAADMVKNELAVSQSELKDAVSFTPLSRPYRASPLSPRTSPLIDTVFVLSADKRILWPNESARLSKKETEFLYWNAPLMTDRVKVPVVKNIALEYKREIINNPTPVTGGSSDEKKSATFGLAETQSTVKAEAPGGLLDAGDGSHADAAAQGASLHFADFPSASAPEADAAPMQSARSAAPSPNRRQATLEREKENRTAITLFEQNKPIREKIYKQAEDEGKEVLTRTTVAKGDTDPSPGSDRSLFILSPGTFSDVISSGDEGFLPRFLGDDFSLLYWRKTSTGAVIGCTVNLDALKERILKRLPIEATPARILVVLDNRAKPLHSPASLDIDWRSPFAAREIHEALPRWEAAAYLADPSSIASKAEAVTTVMWVIIFSLFIVIAGGGVIVIKTLLSELTLAQAKTTLVTNVSHELKTPLTSIRLFAEMLKENIAPGPAKRREYCSLLLSETERLSRLINNVLDFSKMSKGKNHYEKEELDLVSLCRDVAACERVRLIKEGMRISFTSNVKTLPFVGCREALSRVLINLISNAEKYAGRDVGGGSVSILLTRRRTGIDLLVMDRGPGIPPWARKKIFNEFFRVDDSLTARTGGSGLGLTICRMIVVDHGGEIVWEPRPGGGSVFRVSFPSAAYPHGRISHSSETREKSLFRNQAHGKGR